MPEETGSLKGSKFENAIRSTLGIDLNDVDAFDVKIVSMAKKTYFQNIDFDEGKEVKRSAYEVFPAKFTVVEPRFEADLAEGEMKSSEAKQKLKVTVEKGGVLLPARVLFPPENVQLNWPNVKRVGAGLANLGNTCFLNATLQCLTYTPPLYNYLISGLHKAECKVSGFCMTCELQKHVRSCFESGHSAIKPDSILRNLRVIARHLRWGRQEDAHEFLRYLIDAMLKSQLHGYEKLDAASKDTTIVHQIFGGQLCSRVICQKCKHKSDKVDPFLDICMDLKGVGSVEIGLKKFVEPEMLQGKNAYNCQNCKSKVEAQKRFTFHTTPNVLTIQFKRYGIMGGKVTRHIVFSELLDMRPYMSCPNGGSTKYRLYGVLVHDGMSTSSGHYYSYIRAPNHIWHCMNDGSVRPVGVNQVLKAEAYLLFYVREKPAIQSSPVQAAKNSEKQNISQNGISSEKSPAKAPSSNARDEKNLTDRNCLASVNGIFCEKSPTVLNGSTGKSLGTDKKLTKTNSCTAIELRGDKTPTQLEKGLKQRSPEKNRSKTNSFNGIGAADRVSLSLANGTSIEQKTPTQVVLKDTGNEKCFDSSTSSKKSTAFEPKTPVPCVSENGLNTPTSDVVSGAAPSHTKLPETKNSLQAKSSRKPLCSTPMSNGTSQSTETVSTISSPRRLQTTLLSKTEADFQCNATTKWTVVACLSPINPVESSILNATSKWVVTPIETMTNGRCASANGNGADSSSETNNSGSQLSNVVECENSANGQNQSRKLDPLCAIQKWDDIESSRYKNIRSDDSRPKKINQTWDGKRVQKDFLKDFEQVKFAYGAEVSTWNGEKSLMDKLKENERRQQKRRNHDDEYNDELDRGRVKKFKKPKVDVFNGVNPFQKLQERDNQEKQMRLNMYQNMVRS